MAAAAARLLLSCCCHQQFLLLTFPAPSSSHHSDYSLFRIMLTFCAFAATFFQPAIWIGAAIQTPFGTTTVKRSYAPPLLFCCLVTEIEVKAWCRVELLKKAKKKEERRGRGKNIEQVPALHCTAINFAQAHRHTV